MQLRSQCNYGRPLLDGLNSILNLVQAPLWREHGNVVVVLAAELQLHLRSTMREGDATLTHGQRCLAAGGGRTGLTLDLTRAEEVSRDTSTDLAPFQRPPTVLD